ncbi:hypothetical protein O987_01085 [Comamonas testosteroni TK102]|uniref:Uncharacterized protein n=1 Tax=Comamonas testosteroni TK102 TaxID=1392005 RepID=A0A076PC81_COMTE|nr:hypothetical protein O987_01085 [Comamonas testosteroni TK102]
MQGREHDGGQAKDVRHGYEGIAAVGRGQRTRGRRLLRKMAQRIMAQHHSLGLARGTRSEDQACHLGLQRPGFAEAVRLDRAVGHAWQTAGQGLVAPGMCLCAGGSAGREVHGARIGTFGEGIDFGRRHARVDAARPGAYAAAGKDQRCVFGAVLGHDHHAVAGAYLQAAQLLLGLIGQAGDVSKTEAAIGQQDEGGIGSLLQAAFQQMVDACSHGQLISMPWVTVAHMARSLAARSASVWAEPVHSS